jgi:hypothetical protein
MPRPNVITAPTLAALAYVEAESRALTGDFDGAEELRSELDRVGLSEAARRVDNMLAPYVDFDRAEPFA